MVTKYEPSDGIWTLSETAHTLRSLKKTWPAGKYEESKNALKEFLCSYFSSEHDCTSKQGKSISPIGATRRGGKVLKVRWMVPGGGKSGGLRLVVIAYCKEKRVEIAEGVIRADGLPNSLVENLTKDK